MVGTAALAVSSVPAGDAAAGRRPHQWLAYNAFGDVTSVRDPLAQTTTLRYDATGNRTSASDAGAHTTTYAHDAADQLRLAALGRPDPAGERLRRQRQRLGP